MNNRKERKIKERRLSAGSLERVSFSFPVLGLDLAMGWGPWNTKPKDTLVSSWP